MQIAILIAEGIVALHEQLPTNPTPYVDIPHPDRVSSSISLAASRTYYTDGVVMAQVYYLGREIDEVKECLEQAFAQRRIRLLGEVQKIRARLMDTLNFVVQFSTN